MRTAREVAHDGVREGMAWCTHDSYDPAFGRHSSACDRLTAAIEARDRERIANVEQSASIAAHHEDMERRDAKWRLDVSLLQEQLNRDFTLITDARAERDAFKAALEARDAEHTTSVAIERAVTEGWEVENTALRAALEVAKGALERIATKGCALRGVLGPTVKSCLEQDERKSEFRCLQCTANAALSRISTLVDPPGGKR